MKRQTPNKKQAAEVSQHEHTEQATARLILLNDEVNSFEFVIDSLIDVCGHEPEQASQCATLVHYRGQCVIKTLPRKELQKMSKMLAERGLKVVIE